jgi:SynChlorMet cassette protein ScmC
MYSFSLSDGQSWGIRSTEDTRGWADMFARLLALEALRGHPENVIRLERLPRAAGTENDRLGMPPQGCLGEGWRVGLFPFLELWCHPFVRDIVCRLHATADPRRIKQQMRHALLPLYESTVCRGGLPLHTALVERYGRGVLLVGRSGVGKSTACRRLPPGWKVLGDDLALAVRASGGGFSVHPLPTWSVVGTGARERSWDINQAVPLSAIFFLTQAAKDQVSLAGRAVASVILADAAEMIFNSVRASTHAFETSSLKGDIFANAAAMANAVPSYVLRLTLHGRFWEKIDAVLDGQGAQGMDKVMP